MIEHGLHGAATFVAARDPSSLHWDRIRPFPAAFMPPTTAATVRRTSDDWPFLYLRPGEVPWAYMVVLTLVMLGTLALVRAVHGGGALGGDFDAPLFLMGAGFLLVETRGVTSLSLLFGSTWVVNAAVFSGVLIMALVANLAVQRFQPRSTLSAFLALLLALCLLWAADISALNRLPLLSRGLAGGLLNALPVGCAGLIVSTLLARSGNLSASLGSNLLGSVLGGCLEYLSMYTGLRALVLLALALYLGALLIELRRRSRRI